MAKVPYGFDARMPNADDESWTKLATIAEYLEDSEVIPPDLAMWLGEAIRHSKQESKEFMRRLGLAKSKGRPVTKGKEWLIWAEKLDCLEAGGKRPEEALDAVMIESEERHSRASLQKWLKMYRDLK